MTPETRQTLLRWSPEKLVTLIEGRTAQIAALEAELGRINDILVHHGIVIGLQDRFRTHQGVAALGAHLNRTQDLVDHMDALNPLSP